MGQLVTPKRLVVAAALVAAVGIFAWLRYEANPVEISPFLQRGEWVPESERSGAHRVIGLGPHKTSYFMLPTITGSAGADETTYREIQRELYWLDFRFTHGVLLPNLDRSTNLYVAVPDPDVYKEFLGSELEFFIEYLAGKRGWSELEIARRIHPFVTPVPLVWTQDAGEVMIRAGDPLATIYKGASDHEGYLTFLKALTAAYPQVFALKELPPEISGEGGDLEVVWGPDRQPALLVGSHRIVRYMMQAHPGWNPAAPMMQEQIEEARAAFSRAYEGLPVYIVPEKLLLDPSRGSDEVFHLDMLVSVMDHHRGPRPHAFVPDFIPSPVYNALTAQPLDADLVAKSQWEFDEAARQMAALGYEVVRLPLDDHPARSPVNFGKFRSPQTGLYGVLLAKFPYHHHGAQTEPQWRVLSTAWYAEQSGNAWQAQGTPESLALFQKNLARLWEVLEEVQAAPNPIYEERARRIREAGYDVIEVPSYAAGSGGIHCQILK